MADSRARREAGAAIVRDRQQDLAAIERVRLLLIEDGVRDVHRSACVGFGRLARQVGDDRRFVEKLPAGFDAAVDQRHPVEMEIQTCFRVVAVGERRDDNLTERRLLGHRIAIEHHRAEVEASGCRGCQHGIAGRLMTERGRRLTDHRAVHGMPGHEEAGVALTRIVREIHPDPRFGPGFDLLDRLVGFVLTLTPSSVAARGPPR